MQMMNVLSDKRNKEANCEANEEEGGGNGLSAFHAEYTRCMG